MNGSIIDNIETYGVGGINIDDCRIKHNEELKLTNRQNRQEDSVFNNKNCGFDSSKLNIASANPEGRFPANTILTYDETNSEEVIGGFPETNGGTRQNIAFRQSEKNSGYGFDINTRNEYDDSGSASRYFYCAKASKKDRDEGLDNFEERKMYDGKNAGFGYGNTENDNFGDRISNVKRKNIHPTVKPTELMQYLVRLVTPRYGIVLDPFMGSGSTGKAVAYENNERDAHYKFIGIEMEKEYCDIARARISYAKGDRVISVENRETGEVEQKVVKKVKQTSLF